MNTINGTVIFKKKSQKGNIYILWDSENEVQRLFSRNDDIVILDEIDALFRKGTVCDFIHKFTVTSPSPLRNRPEHIIAASYFVSLLSLFTETGKKEKILLEHISSLLNSGSLSWEEIEEVESAWIRLMGIGTDDSNHEKLLEQYAPKVLPIRENLKKNSKYIIKGAVCSQEV
jgi:hypothetical protein